MGYRSYPGLPPVPAGTTPHVRVEGNQLLVDGRPTFLFGGELQYFRVRDAGFDAAATRALWRARLAQLRDAGANLVTTYVPWDYHEPEAGRYDFEGARDLRAFLEIAAEMGFFLVVKPGPHILAEWPYGFGSWGAVPLWWREANPAELVRERSGKPYRWHPFLPEIGPRYNTLPSYASERFREATAAWIARVHEEIRPLLGPGKPIVLLQLDNETNLFWSDAYRIDFHPASLARWRARLEARWGTAAALSDAYGAPLRSFEEAQPPRKGVGAPAAHEDWLAHQHALTEHWLGAVREMWRVVGVNEPDVLFQTNDTHQTFSAREFVLPNGRVKNRFGLHALDTYPRCIPVPRAPRILYDRPYEPDWTNKLIDVYNDAYLGPSRFTLGAEVQGGHFALSVAGRWFEPHKITAASTTQTYLRLLAHGMKAMAIYVLVGGLNIDGSPYGFQAAVAHDGALHPRYEGLRRTGALIRRHERELLASEAVESSVGIVADVDALGAGHGEDGDQRIYGDELRNAFGWLANAGFTPRAIDVRDLGDDGPRGTWARDCRALLFPNGGRFSLEKARLLERYVERGGLLVQSIRKGPLAATLFPAAEAKAPFRLPLLGDEPVRFFVEGAGGSLDMPQRHLTRWRSLPDAEAILTVPGESGLSLGYLRRVGPRGGKACFLSALPMAVYGGPGYYDAEPTALVARSLFARRLLRACGERRLFEIGDVRVECHARRVPSSGALFLFVFRSREAGESTVKLPRPEALGLTATTRYAVDDVFQGDAPRRFLEASGASLRDDGIAVRLDDGGATVLRIERVG